MTKFTIQKGFLLFDQVFINKEVAYQVEDDNGIHKDEVKEGYYIFELNEYNAFSEDKEMVNVPCNYSRFFETLEDAKEDAIEEEMEIV